jgi:hypothetical protein
MRESVTTCRRLSPSAADAGQLTRSPVWVVVRTRFGGVSGVRCGVRVRCAVKCGADLALSGAGPARCVQVTPPGGIRAPVTALGGVRAPVTPPGGIRAPVTALGGVRALGHPARWRPRSRSPRPAASALAVTRPGSIRAQVTPAGGVRAPVTRPGAIRAQVTSAGGVRAPVPPACGVRTRG